MLLCFFFFFQAEDGIRDADVTGVQTCALPICRRGLAVVMGSREGRPMVLTQERRYFRLSARDFDEPPRPVARIDLPRSGSARSARVRRDLAARLATLNVRPPRARRPRWDPAAERKAAEL